ncbi:single-stranded DNA-binding protein [Fulvivirgaceae bacterium BMA12]|uniref:Single-stranded DNA-binding protein n=1 Tax=Agaribacillus aureus TaxID=3051825 RepID=A0ABT8LCQ8_9BACT|nr:single-stranded DNA-binding protein [Fulvivirgaceae bacterium BMA12]
MSKTKPKTKSTPTNDTSKDLFADTNISMKTGHLTKDAEVISDGKYAKIRFASNKEYETSEGEVKTRTSYFNALVNSNLTDAFETAKTLKKGDWVYLKGEDVTKSFDTPEGYKQTASTIFAYKVVLKKAKANAHAGAMTTSSNQEDPAPAIAS